MLQSTAESPMRQVKCTIWMIHDEHRRAHHHRKDIYLNAPWNYRMLILGLMIQVKLSSKTYYKFVTIKICMELQLVEYSMAMGSVRRLC